MTINKFIRFIFLPPFFYFASFWLLIHYTLGDQILYTRFYEALQSAGLADVMQLSLVHVDSGEPVSAFLLWSAAKIGIPKIAFISALNTVLLLQIYTFLQALEAPSFVYPLVYTNFYLLVLLTSAERLKISFIVLLLAFFAPKKGRTILLGVSVFAHFQSIILLSSFYLASLSAPLLKFCRTFRIEKSQLIYTFLLLIGSGLVLFYIYDRLISKFVFYSTSAMSYSSILNISALVFSALLCVRDRLKLILAFLPLAVSAYFLGSDRVNMISFVVVFYFLGQEKRLSSPIVVILLLYLSAKSAPFLVNILLYGDGYAGFLF